MQEQGALPSPFERDYNDLRQPGGGQIRNEAGCYTNQIDDLRRLERFTVVGAEQGYRATEEGLSREKLQCLDRLIRGGRGPEAVALIEKISRERRNLRQKPLLFAFALCARAKDSPTSKSAYRCFLNICRTPTHLFLFVKFCEEFSEPGRGWGRAHKRAIQRWYLQFKNNPLRLFRLVTKYKKREGWTHTDVLRLAHPKPLTNALAYIFSYITEKPYKPITNTVVEDGQIDWMRRYEAARKMEEDDMRFPIQEYGFSWEHIPTSMLNSSRIWQALLKDMPVEAFLRNLGRMTRLGMFQENSEEEETAISKIGNMNIAATSDIESTAANDDNDVDDEEEDYFTRRNIIHPFRIFVALQNYKAGHGCGRTLTWIPSTAIIRALENAFNTAFKCLEPINKKCLIAVDVSLSMNQPALRTSNITCTMAAAAMMMSFTRAQSNHSNQPNIPNTIVGGFSSGFTDVQISRLTTPEGTMRTMSECRPDGELSNCSSPIKWATENRIDDIEAFIIFTANINSCGNIHPAEAVRQYRQYTGNNGVKLVVVGLLDNDFSIADQLDWDMMDVAGFDLALPHVVAEFVGNND